MTTKPRHLTRTMPSLSGFRLLVLILLNSHWLSKQSTLLSPCQTGGVMNGESQKPSVNLFVSLPVRRLLMRFRTIRRSRTLRFGGTRSSRFHPSASLGARFWPSGWLKSSRNSRLRTRRFNHQMHFRQRPRPLQCRKVLKSHFNSLPFLPGPRHRSTYKDQRKPRQANSCLKKTAWNLRRAQSARSLGCHQCLAET